MPRLADVRQDAETLWEIHKELTRICRDIQNQAESYGLEPKVPPLRVKHSGEVDRAREFLPKFVLAAKKALKVYRDTGSTEGIDPKKEPTKKKKK